MITAIESFTSEGGMLPEQIWDAPDLPAKGMFLGRPSGSAMPLAWAHSEYIKLLRSCSDGAIFDRVEPVAERYLHGKRSLSVEICKRDRLLESIAAGKTLRIMEDTRFRLLWTQDDWQTQQTVDSKYMGTSICYADIPIGKRNQGNLSFTLYWMDEGRWEGRNYDVPIH
jgi:glucoamylase